MTSGGGRCTLVTVTARMGVGPVVTEREEAQVPFFYQDSAVPHVGDRVDVYASISGDSGEIFASRDNVRVQR